MESHVTLVLTLTIGLELTLTLVFGLDGWIYGLWS
jgi:hypothetical protein